MDLFCSKSLFTFGEKNEYCESLRECNQLVASVFSWLIETGVPWVSLNLIDSCNLALSTIEDSQPFSGVVFSL